MTSLGQVLKAAREEKHLTASEVAEATRIKVQIIEDIESNAFRKIPAPIYGKGFIKMYAEYVGLNPAPLVDEYLKEMLSRSAPTRSVEAPPKPTAAPPQIEVEVERPRRKHEHRAAPRAEVPMFLVMKEAVSRLGEQIKKVNLPSMPPMDEMGEKLRSLGRPVASGTARYVALAICGLVVLILLVSGVSRLVSSLRQPAVPLSVYEAREPLRLTHEPPAPYLDAKPAR